ncbi:hypothetical protein [Clostridium fallax]|uniref:Uncharacterized protein n=1 Tax=Clostridium fallax TaxID=1533 RepID=A0A1M4ZBC1_9CLOT|nr:hypothetical protein [Clostridium fallax]SHF15258.1 hypothetical protein SAMN05443638_1418 [Clostridium fallax]SQB22253.1 Uncharacterised protein [Clostridium fallax]
MFESTKELKIKYFDKINDVLNNYDEMIKKINHVLLVYGIDFYKFSQGQITLEYINNQRNNLLIDLKNINQETFSKIIESLNSIRKDYIKECFPIKETTDKLELEFIEKELSVMNCDELQEFYKSNFLDKNKVRLFDIEIKKRENSVNDSGISIGIVKNLRETYTIEDEVIDNINEWTKFFEGGRQIVSGALVLIKGFDNQGKFIPEIISHNEIIQFTQDFYRKQATNKINIVSIF